MCLLKQQNLLDVLKCNLRPCYISCNISCATTSGVTWVLHGCYILFTGCPRCFPFHYQTLFVRLVAPCFYACFCLALTPQEFKDLGWRFYWNQACTWLSLMWSLIVVMPLSLGFMLHFLTHCLWRHCHVFQRNSNPMNLMVWKDVIRMQLYDVTMWPVNELLICTKLQWFMLFTKAPILFTRISPMDYGGPYFPRMFPTGSQLNNNNLHMLLMLV